MEHIQSESVPFSRLNIERAKEQAKAARSQFFRENSKLTMQWLGRVALVCGLAIMVTFLARPASQRALEATVIMERLASALNNSKTIAPDTARAISQLLRHSDYDCKQLACDAALERRNRVVRSKLESMLITPSEQIATNRLSSFGLGK